MNITLKILAKQLDNIRTDLVRPHRFAGERVGFISCRFGSKLDGIVAIAHEYHPVEDANYIEDDSCGAVIGSRAISNALHTAYIREVGMFHVHLHQHFGSPRFSQLDRTENSRFVPDFFNVRPDLLHGAIVLSYDSAFGICWLSADTGPIYINEFVSVGFPIWKGPLP